MKVTRFCANRCRKICWRWFTDGEKMAARSIDPALYQLGVNRVEAPSPIGSGLMVYGC
jgi:hypothetical protein